MRVVASLLVLATLATTAVGCSTTVGRFPVVTTKNVELSRVDLKEVGLQRNVEGSDGRLWFLFFPLGFSPTIERAMDECLNRGRGDFLVSARVDYFIWTFILFTYESYTVYGDAGDSLGAGTRDVENAPAPRGYKYEQEADQQRRSSR